MEYIIVDIFHNIICWYIPIYHMEYIIIEKLDILEIGWYDNNNMCHCLKQFY